MSGAGLIELLAARLGGRGVRRASPSLREALVDLSARSAEPGVAGQEEALRQAYGRLSMEMPTENLRLPTSRVSLDDLPDVGPGWRDKDKVAHYADLLAQSEPPPIMIARDARNGAWDVIDGNHRLEVMRAAGRREIPAMDATGAFKGRYVSSDAMPPKAAPRRTGPDAGPVQGGRTSGLVDIKLNDSRVPGGGPWRAITVPRDPASFNPANAWREGGFLPEANVGGYLQYDPTKWRVLETHLDDDLRGQGMGVRMYEDLIERARRARQPYIDSDSYVSPEAQRVYEALERRGYTVTRREGRDGPTFRVETERAARTAPDGGPAQAGVRVYRGRRHNGADDGPIRYYTDRPQYASNMASNDFMSGGFDEGAHVAPYQLNMQRPFVADEGVHRIVEEPMDGNLERLIERLRSEGYDAIDDRQWGSQIIPLSDEIIQPAFGQNASRTGPNAGPAQTVGVLPSATSEGVTTYRGENTHVRIQPFPRRGVTEVTWDVNGGRAPSGLADRARLEQEGIDTALRAMQQHAAQNGDVTYTVHGSNGALARRYRRMAQERAEAAGFTFEETPSGGLIFRRADSANRSDRNALQRALRDRMNRE